MKTILTAIIFSVAPYTIALAESNCELEPIIDSSVGGMVIGAGVGLAAGVSSAVSGGASWVYITLYGAEAAIIGGGAGAAVGATAGAYASCQFDIAEAETIPEISGEELEESLKDMGNKLIDMVPSN